MQTSTVFKQVTPQNTTPEVIPTGKETTRGGEVEIEPPYLDYVKESSKPYLAEYFGLGDTWNDRQGGFPEEIEAIEGYVREKIESGDIANSINAVKELIKGLEKMNNLTKEERAVVKIEVLANYIEFMNKNAEVKKNLRRYANT